VIGEGEWARNNIKSAASLSSVSLPSVDFGGVLDLTLRGDMCISDCARARVEDSASGAKGESGRPRKEACVGDPDPSMDVRALAASTSWRVVDCVECEYDRLFFSPCLNGRSGDAGCSTVELLRRCPAMGG
jgi:hypothetical protein